MSIACRVEVVELCLDIRVEVLEAGLAAGLGPRRAEEAADELMGALTF